MLGTREYYFDPEGRLVVDDSAAAAASARLAAESWLEWEAGLAIEVAAANTDAPSPRSADRAREGDAEEAAIYALWRLERRKRADLQAVRAELREAALLGRVITGFQRAGTSRSGLTSPGGPEVGDLSPPPRDHEQRKGSEPPPSPAPRRRTRASRVSQNSAADGLSAGSSRLGVGEAPDERYRNTCHALGCPASPVVCSALCALEDGGGDSLPLSFPGRAYLGNRGGQALFLSMAAGEDPEDEGGPGGPLSELRKLDLGGQGLGNEAAQALASMLFACPELRELNLAKNHISETGAQRLLKEISDHPSLIRVSLDLNPAPSWVRVRLREVLEERQKLLRKTKF